MLSPRYWQGHLDPSCQVSGEPLGSVMYDAYIPTIQTWANVCHDTFVLTGAQLGVGKGQKYELQDDGRWLCTAGSVTTPRAAILSDEDKRQIADEAASRKGQ